MNLRSFTTLLCLFITALACNQPASKPGNQPGSQSGNHPDSPASSSAAGPVNSNPDSNHTSSPDSIATAIDTAGEAPEPIPNPSTPLSNPLSENRTPHPIHLQKGVNLNLSLPQGYDISIAREGLKRLRFLAKSPDGRLFATDMYDVNDNKKGRVYVFDNWDTTDHSFKSLHIFLANLHNPNQIAFCRDKNIDYIYVSETGRLTRYPYHAGDTIPAGPGQQIASWPDYGLSYKYGGWHLTRSLDFHNGKLYVSVGSSCNACIEKESVRATIQEMDPDGKNQVTYATGLRNAVGIKWVDDKLWVTNMGRDLLGRDRPEDLFHTVQKGGFYGWPYFYQYQGRIYPDTAISNLAKESRQPIPNPSTRAYCGFLAHSAPLGLAFFKGFSDPRLNNSFLVALHGSTTVSRKRGNSIVKITGPDQYVPVVDGFLAEPGKSDKDRKGRPCDVMMNDAGSFFFTDDYNGVLYFVWKK